MATKGQLLDQNINENLDDVKHKIALCSKEKKKANKSLPFSKEELPFDIPANWEWIRLNDLCKSISDGTHKTPHYVEEGVPFVSVKDISSGYLSFEDTKFITEAEHKELIRRCKPERDDILICRIGTLGKAITIDTDKEFSIFVSLGLIKPIIKDMSKYLALVINSGYGFSWIQRVKVGGGTHTFKINLDDLRLMPIPLPPLEEQKRIVAIK